MTHLIVAHFQSSNSAAQASAAQILHAQTGGLLLKPGTLDGQGEHVNNSQRLTENENALQDHYCTMMTSPRGGIIDVSIEHLNAMIAFIQLRRHVLTELKTIIVSVSPDTASQQAAVETLTAICAAGVAPACIRILATDVPADAQVDDAYPSIVEYAREAQIAVTPDAVLPVSTSFAKAQQFKMPIAAVLNRAVDFETELTSARVNGAPEKIMYALAHKVIAQRDLLGTADTFKRVAGTLGLPCISQDEWRAECAPGTNRKRARTVALD
ncbi:hypothetical protein [Paraburkholderia diazotrophica]|uniref:Uncharacterized protein n=1 Tax=Paraburkholderia diazotrophica TaxID=667676 RepID=A0A1H6UDU7_9BURK|nr:hypothetical protein [Paraburkholderia diazotrophica]SEI86360.1 hypothetical protein SAMN05192539_1004344 [Paraburkholderia diazotrophica]